MRAPLLAAAIALAVLASAGSVAAETVVFHTGQYAHFAQLAAGGKPMAEASISATLSFPERPRTRNPAVVLVHGLGGFLEENEGWHAAQVRKAGFATLTYHSPTAKSMRRAALSGSQDAPPWATAVAEAYAALAVLAADPRIDAGRIAIVGFSFGGEVAHLAAFEGVRRTLATGHSRYAAHVAYYPAGVQGAMARAGAYTGSPVLMLLGEQDDNLPLHKAEAYVRYARHGASAPIDVSIYPGAYHAWTVPGLGAPRFYPEYASTRRCPYILLGSSRPSVLIDGQEKPLERDSIRACLTAGRGYTMGYDEEARAKAAGETVDFLVGKLGL